MFYRDETVRLLRDVPEAGLVKGKEYNIVGTVADNDGNVSAVEVQYYSAGAAQSLTLPADAVERVLSKSTEQRTAVFWGLRKPPAEFIEACLHSIMDEGYQMLEGLNLVELSYDPHDRWWKWGEPMNDAAGARVARAGPGWDGCVAAFSGRERFHLEFRLKGRDEPCVLLHEREEPYQDQVNNSSAAMSLQRILMNLCAASGAQQCAFPVADPWLMDENWKSLLRHPYYPDMFLLSETMQVRDLPDEFRKGRLSGGRVILTTLPVKFAPHDEIPRPSERDLQLSGMRKCASLGEKYYDQLYETRLSKTGLYSNLKDAFIDAISLANKLGFKEYADALDKRMEHFKAVYRSQFT